MTQLVKDTAKMMEMLPEDDQKLANELIKKLVLAWDPDFTKLTEKEEMRLESAEKRISSGDYISGESINWGE